MSAVVEEQGACVRAVDELQPSLVQHFDLLAGSLGGVAQLRALVLALAVRGKLVPQDSKDEPASRLLDRVRAARESTTSAGRGRRSTALPSVGKEEERYPLPPGWAWARIGELGHVVGGGTPKSDVAEYWADAGVPWLTPADLYGWSDVRISRGRRDISQEGLAASSARVLPAGSVLFSSRAPIGYVAIAGAPVATNQGFKSCVPYVSGLSEYIYWHLRQLAPAIDAVASGTTFKEISGAEFARLVVALPPINEQARIVARVDELMRLCDALEAKGRLEAEQHVRLLDTLLGTLTESTTAKELSAKWKRVAEHFDLLLDRPEAVDMLEKVLLQLGLCGALARASEVNVESVNGRLGESGAVRPCSWPTVKFGDVLTDLRYGTSAKCSYGALGTPVLRIPNLRDGHIDLTDLKYASLDDREASKLRLERGDLLIVRSNGSAGLVGSAALVSADLNGFAFAGYLMRARLNKNRVLPEYMALVFRAPEVRRQIESPIRTTSGVKNINSSEISRLSFLLPPIESQAWIVSYIAELRRRCSSFRQRLLLSQATTNRLSRAFADMIVGK